MSVEAPNDAIDAVADVFRNAQDHFVRWSAVRVALVLDSRRGSELLKMAIDDGHPHVRAAATKALQTSRALQIHLASLPHRVPIRGHYHPFRSDGHDTHFG
jgi:hypothetical protein